MEKPLKVIFQGRAGLVVLCLFRLGVHIMQQRCLYKPINPLRSHVNVLKYWLREGFGFSVFSELKEKSSLFRQIVGNILEGLRLFNRCWKDWVSIYEKAFESLTKAFQATWFIVIIFFVEYECWQWNQTVSLHILLNANITLCQRWQIFMFQIKLKWSNPSQ